MPVEGVLFIIATALLLLQATYLWQQMKLRRGRARKPQGFPNPTSRLIMVDLTPFLPFLPLPTQLRAPEGVEDRCHAWKDQQWSQVIVNAAAVKGRAEQDPPSREH